ncbi:hypothetical protein JZ751_013256, partial [Albula glossodonta]
GLVREPHSRTVQQVRLRCTEGTVEWVYPSQALRVILEPNLSSTRHTTVCIKPFRTFGGASVFIERAGELNLLMTEGGRPEQVHCFRVEGRQIPAIFLQASPQRDISRRMVGFRYELLGNHSTAPDFRATVLQVVRGSIRNVSHDSERQTSVVYVTEGRVYRQRSGVFEHEAGGLGAWRGHIRTLLQCQVRAGAGDFLFTGAEHFGEAWLGCAPRYKDFLSVYRAARMARRNPCEFPLD